MPWAWTSTRRLFPDCRFEHRDVADVAAEFDVIYCSEVIEHLPQPIPFLRALRSILAPGGVVFLTTPDMGHRSLPRGARDLIATEEIRPPEHLLYLGRPALSAMLEESGFGDVRFMLNLEPTLKVLARGAMIGPST